MIVFARRAGLVATMILVSACASLNDDAKNVRFADAKDEANGLRHCKELGPVSARMMLSDYEAENAVKNQAAALGGNVVRRTGGILDGFVSGVAMKCGPIATEPLMAASRPVSCSAGRDCQVKWSRAIEWLQQNSTWKFEVVTDVLITTAGPGNTTKPAFEITKAPTELEGTDRIQIRVFCSQGVAGIFGCDPPADRLTQQFVDYLK
ncbi:MAG: hypothetical protein JJE51_12710 [Thermoanaerobaculia bacterium]|nr:hypothetical protein [Thermoanaerobaculia bacterium]